MTTLPQDAQRRIDQHLDAIDAALGSAGMTRSERNAILDDVRGQVAEMIESRVTGTPTVADIEAVVAELDPPEAYKGQAAYPSGSSCDSRRIFQRNLTRTAVSAGLAGLFLLMGLTTLAFIRSSGAPRGLSATLSVVGMIAMFLFAALFAVLFYAITISGIRHSEGRLKGLRVALFFVLTLPVIGVCALGVFRHLLIIFG